jgi:hypothetical protein
MNKPDHTTEQQRFNEKPKIPELVTPEPRPQFADNEGDNDTVLYARPAQNKCHLIPQAHHGTAEAEIKGLASIQPAPARQ